MKAQAVEKNTHGLSVRLPVSTAGKLKGAHMGKYEQTVGQEVHLQFFWGDYGGAKCVVSSIPRAQLGSVSESLYLPRKIAVRLATSSAVNALAHPRKSAIYNWVQ